MENDIAILWSLKVFIVPPLKDDLPFIIIPSSNSSTFAPSNFKLSTTDFILLLSLTFNSAASYIIVFPSALVANMAIIGISSINFGIKSLSMVVPIKLGL